MKPSPIIPPSRRVPVKRAKPIHETLERAIENYYQTHLAAGFSARDAATCTLAFVRDILKGRLP